MESDIPIAHRGGMAMDPVYTERDEMGPPPPRLDNMRDNLCDINQQLGTIFSRVVQIGARLEGARPLGSARVEDSKPEVPAPGGVIDDLERIIEECYRQIGDIHCQLQHLEKI